MSAVPDEQLGLGHYLYSWISGILFLACAYAQLNDPDPFLYGLLYFGGGTGLALYQYVFKFKKPFIDRGRKKNDDTVLMDA